jgi:hypothetical protein
MYEADNHSRHLFIIRIWFEAASANQRQLRGQVEHVPSGQKLYFTSLNDLDDFINLRTEAYTGSDPPVFSVRREKAP